MRRYLLGAWILLLGPFAPARAEERPFTVHDLLAMQRISDPQVSPDGGQVAFALRTTDLEANRGRSDLWLVGIAEPASGNGTGLRRLTTSGTNDTNPRFTADGTSLLFLSSRSGSTQVWRLPMAGGEAVPVTDLPLDVSSFLLSPDGLTLALVLEVYPDCDDLDCTVDRLQSHATRPATGQAFDRLFLRHWDTWKDGRRSHLFVRPLSGGAVRDVTLGIDGDVPSKPFGGTEEITFTPDSRGLVFALRQEGAQEPWSTNFDLYHAALDSVAEPRNLTPDNPAWDTHPVFSPDGRFLAYLAMERAGYEADRFRLVLREWSSGSEREIAADWDRSVGDFVFASDGGTIYATAADLGETPLFAIDVGSGEATRLVRGGRVRSPRRAGERLVYGFEHLRSPVELFTIDGDGSDRTQLTHINQARLAEARMGSYEQFSFRGWNGETVYGYVLRPADFQPDRTYPVAFLIHGGPQGSFGNGFHYRWNPQTYSGAGYGVVMIDFHGSVGYGQAFTDSIRADWGGKPLVDLKRGLAAALEQYRFLDGDRVCALGASYGGYMINWIAGNWPERFRCLVNHDGVFDNRMMYYATEELWFPEWDHDGPYFENPQTHEKHNPVQFVDRWQTPMLIVHGALDFRVPETQGFAAFTALQRRGVPSRFLYFPDENHWVRKPHNSIQWHEEVLAWLDRWSGDD